MRLAQAYGLPGACSRVQTAVLVVMPIVAVSAAVAMATTALVAAPRRAANRALAAVLLAEGLYFLGLTLGSVLPDERLAYNAHVYGNIAGPWLSPFLYLLFVGYAVDSPLASPLRRPAFRWPLAATMVAGAVLLVTLAPRLFGAPKYLDGGARVFPDLPLAIPLFLFSIPVFAFGIACAVSTYRRAPAGSVARRRARAYAIAFGFHDGGIIALVVVMNLAGLGPEPTLLLARTAFPAVFVLAFALILYALVRHQILNFELRLKRTLRQSTLAAIFVAVFFVVSESAAAFFQGSVGTYLGIAAAGLLVLTFAPLQRMAERLTDAAMPHVRPTPEYLAYKKLEVYRAAVEVAHESNGIDERERAILQRLREKLDLAPQDADALEAEVGARDAPA